MVRPRRILIALMAVALLAAGCSRGGEETTTAGGSGGGSGDFGDLKGICHSGKPSSSPAQGVTPGEIKLGVFSDVGFTKNPEFADAAKVFTSWCNDNGGIGGRKLSFTVHDAKLLEVRQRMLEACRDDFALVGGGAAFDGLGVKDRLSCTLPDFPAQVVSIANAGSDLQVGGGSTAGKLDIYTGSHSWLFKEAYPDSANAIGLITGDTPVTKTMLNGYQESLPAEGATLVYSDLYPAAGVTDWTPYAQAIKSKGVKGLIFLGNYVDLPKLEDVLTSMNYKLDWIDANSNAYSPAFLKLLGNSTTEQHNYADISGTAPLESDLPAIKQLKDLYAKYAPGSAPTYPAVRAFGAWTLFAKAASSCGDALTRRCVYDAAIKETAWTGGGLEAPQDFTPNTSNLPKCFNVEMVTPQGWQPAPFKPDTGPYRCDMQPYVYKQDLGKPMTLADVGKTLNDVK
jgi:hypothetical protein